MTSQKRELVVPLDGRNVRLLLRRSKRAQRIAIRVDPARGGPELVLPEHVSERTGLTFLDERAQWLLTQLDKIPNNVPFQAGQTIPYRDTPHRIVHDAKARRGVWRRGDSIVVSGREEHVPRRIRDWLRRETLAAIKPICRDKAAMLNRTHGRISIRDQKSRWGSCSAAGNLSFNWRLILTPESVLEYVVAHEVGHLAEPNHSPAFWAVVDQLTPHAKAGRSWLKQFGSGLYRYG